MIAFSEPMLDLVQVGHNYNITIIIRRTADCITVGFTLRIHHYRSCLCQVVANNRLGLNGGGPGCQQRIAVLKRIQPSYLRPVRDGRPRKTQGSFPGVGRSVLDLSGVINQLM